jgi:hypothetical protein
MGRGTVLVWLSVKNETQGHLGLAQCALRVVLARTMVDNGAVDVDASCPSGSPILDMGPGDSTMQTHLLTADTLASLASGVWAISVSETDNIGAWQAFPAGRIVLPLASPQ